MTRKTDRLPEVFKHDDPNTRRIIWLSPNQKHAITEETGTLYHWEFHGWTCSPIASGIEARKSARHPLTPAYVRRAILRHVPEGA